MYCIICRKEEKQQQQLQNNLQSKNFCQSAPLTLYISNLEIQFSDGRLAGSDVQKKKTRRQVSERQRGKKAKNKNKKQNKNKHKQTNKQTKNNFRWKKFCQSDPLTLHVSNLEIQFSDGRSADRMYKTQQVSEVCVKARLSHTVASSMVVFQRCQLVWSPWVCWE